MKFLLSLLFALVFIPLSAEMQNHYFLGSHGVNSAVKPRQGADYESIFTYYRANSLKDQHGHSVNLRGYNDHLKMDFLQNKFSYYSLYGLCGVLWGCQVNVPFATGESDFIVFNDSFDLRGGSLKLSDIYVEPINLRYQCQRLYAYGSYGFVMPTGRFHPYSPKNTGLGNWGQMLNLAFTYFFDSCQTFSASIFCNYEFHSKKKHIDFTPGNNLCIDWGVGKIFPQYYTTIGVVGYYERQTTKNTGDEIPYPFQHERDRVFAVGPEISVNIPKYIGKVTVRYEFEFGVLSRTQGRSLIVEGITIF